MGAPMRHTSAVTNSEPSSHGSGTPATRAKAPPAAAAANGPAAEANRRRKSDRELGEAGASSFMPPRAWFDPGSGGGRRGVAHRIRQRQRLVRTVEELDGHEHHLAVADVFEVVHLELAGPVGL